VGTPPAGMLADLVLLSGTSRDAARGDRPLPSPSPSAVTCDAPGELVSAEPNLSRVRLFLASAHDTAQPLPLLPHLPEIIRLAVMLCVRSSVSPNVTTPPRARIEVSQETVLLCGAGLPHSCRQETPGES
jgi:hypothetical protein